MSKPSTWERVDLKYGGSVAVGGLTVDYPCREGLARLTVAQGGKSNVVVELTLTANELNYLLGVVSRALRALDNQELEA